MNEKIIDRKDIGEVCARIREEGRTIVFTNGCFDVLHPGHIDCLFKARSQGDVLVVGLNSDCSVSRLKGKTRPIFPQRERAELLSSFYFVDYVVVFSEWTPLELVQEVRPHVLVKGGDYNPKTIVGRKEVEADGGRLVVIPHLPGYSSSNIINDIIKNEAG